MPQKTWKSGTEISGVHANQHLAMIGQSKMRLQVFDSLLPQKTDDSA